MKQISTTAVVLSRTNFGEADRILTVITPDNGKVRLLAKGVRKIKSKLAGGIELFSVSQISFILGRGEIRTLTSSRLERHFGQIVKELDRTTFAYEVLKLINKTTEDESGDEYFQLTRKMLEALNDIKIPLDLLKLWFYMQLLKLGGHSPNLRTDKQDKPLQTGKNYTFDLDNMIFVEARQGRYKDKHIKLLRLGISLDAPTQLVQIKDADKVILPCLQLAKTMLSQYVRLSNLF